MIWDLKMAMDPSKGKPGSFQAWENCKSWVQNHPTFADDAHWHWRTCCCMPRSAMFSRVSGSKLETFDLACAQLYTHWEMFVHPFWNSMHSGGWSPTFYINIVLCPIIHPSIKETKWHLIMSDNCLLDPTSTLHKSNIAMGHILSAKLSWKKHV